MSGTRLHPRGNTGTALVLSAIALAFFIGVVLKYWLLK